MNAKWRLVALLWLLQLVNYLDRANISVAAPYIIRDLGLSPLDFGIVLAAFSVGYATLQIPGGMLADRFGARTVLIAAPIAWSVFVGATGLATSLATLVAARLLFGLCEGSSAAAIFKAVGEYFPAKERGQANSLWLTSYAFGPALAAPLVATIIQLEGWRSVFYLCAIPGFIVALLLALMLPRNQAVITGPSHSTVGLSSIMRRPATWLLFFAAFFFNISYWGLLGWMPTYLSAARGIDIKAMGWAASIPYLAAAIGLFVIGGVDRQFFHHRRGSMVAGCLVLAAGSLWAAFSADTVVQSIAGLSMAAFFLFGVLGSYGAMLISLAPEGAQGGFAGLIGTGLQASGVIAPIVIGFVVKETGSFAGGFAFMIGTLLISALCYVALDRMMTRELQPRPPSAKLQAEGT